MIALLNLLLLEACASVNPPLERESGYPSEWPDIVSLGEHCADLAGQYVNHGTAVNPEGATRPIALTDILLDESVSGMDSISLEAVTKGRPDPGKDSFARLRIGLDRQEPSERELDNCFCIDRALFCPGLHATNIEGPGFGMIGGQQNVWLIKGNDGTLLVRIESHTTGIVLVVPVHSGSALWARFDKAPPDSTPHVGP